MENALHPVHGPPNRPRTAIRPAFVLDSVVIVSATAFPLVKALLVGASGFEPVTSSVSAKHREPLC
jgi:hypothetical protein